MLDFPFSDQILLLNCRDTYTHTRPAKQLAYEGVSSLTLGHILFDYFFLIFTSSKERC